MSKKKKLRFLKCVMLYSLLMSTVITIAVLIIGLKALEIQGSTVTALCALWSIELSLSAWIKVSEGKNLPKTSGQAYEGESI